MVVAAQNASAVMLAAKGHTPPGRAVLRRIRAFQKRGKYAESAAICEKLLRQGYLDGNLLLLHGLALARCGDIAQAAQKFELAHRMDPENAAILTAMGNLAESNGHLDRAIEIFKTVTRLEQGNFAAWINLGRCLLASGRLKAAELAFNCAHGLDRANPEPLQNLANVYLAAGNSDRARAIIDDLLSNEAAATPALRLKRLQIAARQQDFDFIASEYDAMDRTSMTEDEVAVLENIRAFHLEVSGRIDEAIRLLESLVQKPGAHRLHLRAQLAGLHAAAGEPEKAARLYSGILDEEPGHVAARYNLALQQFSTGDLEEAHANYEARWQWSEFPSRRRIFDFPQWTGEPLEGKKIIVWREQGLGDEVRYASLLPELRDRGCEILFECTPKLSGVFRNSMPWLDVRPEGPLDCRNQGDYAGFDFHIPVGSLAAELRPGIGAFEAQKPWLSRDHEAETAIRRQSGLADGEVLIGLCWRSSNQRASRDRYFLDVSQLGSLNKLPEARFLNLQYDATPREISRAREPGLPLLNYSDVDQMNDLETACKLMGACDLVITIGGAVGDLAGGLGVPMLYVTRENSEVFLGTGRVPWFPSARALPIRPNGGDAVIQSIIDDWPEILAWLKEGKTLGNSASQGSPAERDDRKTGFCGGLDLQFFVNPAALKGPGDEHHRIAGR